MSWERVDPACTEEVFVVVACALEAAGGADWEGLAAMGDLGTAVLSAAGGVGRSHGGAETVSMESDGLEMVLKQLWPSELGLTGKVDLEAL